MKLKRLGSSLLMIDLENCKEDKIPTEFPNTNNSGLHILCLIYCHSSQDISQAIDPSLYNKILEAFHKYLLVFDKTAANCMPVKWVWDYEIKLKEGFISKAAKVYPLSPTNYTAVEEWLDEHLFKGYITESKSS